MTKDSLPSNSDTCQITNSPRKEKSNNKKNEKYFSNNAGQLQENDYTSSEIQQSQILDPVLVKLNIKKKELVLAKEKKVK
ncbi:26153_t:CDS:2, partial [Gigaspora margarita]